MTSLDDIRAALRKIDLPGGDLISRDLVRALSFEAGEVKFVIEADAAEAAQLARLEARIASVLKDLPGVEQVSMVVTAHQATPPPLKVGRHPTAQPEGPQGVPGVARIIAIGSGKGGVGKSTVSSNLAVALARAGKKVGLLDADLYGPSQPRMLGVTRRAASPDGQRIEPVVAHGVTMMSLGLMAPEGQAVVWRGPMLMGALQQLLGQVEWGQLDVLLIDLPPGTGDIQLSLCQRTQLTGAVIVSTPQDVALLDARKAIDMFNKLKTPVLGLVENMASLSCPKCGHEMHPFGQGGVQAEAQERGLPFLGALPLDLETRLAGDAGTPIATGDTDMARAYGALAQRLIDGGLV